LGVYCTGKATKTHKAICEGMQCMTKE